MSSWQPSLESILSNLAAALLLWCLFKAGKLGMHLGGLAATINDRWGLRLAQKDLAQILACQRDRQEIFHFTLIGFGYWLTAASAGFLFLTLALIGHGRFVAPIIFLICALLYLIAVRTTGLIYWSRNPDKFVPILQQRIERILVRIEKREGRKLPTKVRPQ